MPTLQDIGYTVQDKLEEARGPGIFWNLQSELYPAIVEGMNEAALITGDPEQRALATTLVPGGTVSGAPPFVYAMPSTAILLVRMDAVGSGTIKKVFACDLDRNNPGWEGETGDVIKRWFPIGLTMFGIWPALIAPVMVNLTVLSFPITTNAPYTGAEVSPFREEYTDAFSEYAAHIARLKEGGVDFQESIPQYQSFQDKMVSLTKFAARRGLSRFTRIVRQTKVNDVFSK
jgi:hypothetical protein